MDNINNVYRRVSFFDTLKFFYVFLFSNPRKIKVENQPVHDWLIQQLADYKSNMLLVAGELAIAIEEPEVVEKFEEAVKKGKKIKVFCGPKIFTKGGKNELYSFLLNCNQNNSYKNLEVFGANDDNMPLFHFIVNGRNVCIERPHLPSEATDSNLKTCILSNSILWYNRLNIIFNNLLNRKTLRIQDLELTDMEGLTQYENSPQFEKVKERILKSKKFI